MESFPATFNQAAVEAELLKLHATSSAANYARTYVFEQHQKYLASGKPYFSIDLTPYSSAVRVIIIDELLSRFPAVGYRGLTQNDHQDRLMRMALTGELSSPKSTAQQSVILIKTASTVENETKFVIAMTANCAKTLTTYKW